MKLTVQHFISTRERLSPTRGTSDMLVRIAMLYCILMKVNALAVQRLNIPLETSSPTYSPPLGFGGLKLGIDLDEMDDLEEDSGESFPLNNYMDVMYTGKVTVGGKEFSVVFDTGSADIWLFSSHAREELKNVYTSYYNSSESDTYDSSIENDRFAIQYGLGQVKGFLARENVCMGENYCVKSQTFAQVTDWSENFNNPDEPLDGIVGLAFSEASHNNRGQNFLDSLKDQGKISERVFSFYLAGAASVMTLGPPDPDYYHDNEEIYYRDLIPGNIGMWFIYLADVWIDKGEIGLCSGRCVGLLDTGSSFLGVPPKVYLRILEHIKRVRPDCASLEEHENGLQCRKNTYAGLPSFDIVIGGRLFSLNPVDYIVGYMQIGIMPISLDSASGVDVFVLGDVFLKKFYTVFDQENKRVGFVTARMPFDFFGLSVYEWLLGLGIGLIFVGALLSMSIWKEHKRASRRLSKGSQKESEHELMSSSGSETIV